MRKERKRDRASENEHFCLRERRNACERYRHNTQYITLLFSLGKRKKKKKTFKNVIKGDN